MLSLALIVKNEEKNLKRVLDSAKGLWDELVIVDTGSTDKTVEIAKQYTDKIFNFTWVKDFSKARNFAFSKCTNPWIMWLDADDVLHAKDVEVIKTEFNLIKNNLSIDFILMNYHYAVKTAKDVNNVGWSEQDQPIATLVRERIIRKEAAIWRGRCHEHILVDFSKSNTIAASVWHMRTEEDIKADINRNIELMKLEVKDNPSDRNYFYLGQEYFDSFKFEPAIEAYKQAFKISSIQDIKFQSAFKIAKCYKALKNWEDSINWFLTAINQQLTYREPLLELADVYAIIKDFSKAAHWAESALLISEPEHPHMVTQKDYYTWLPYDMLAKYHFELKNFKKAYQMSEKLYEISKNPGILNDLAVIKACLKKSYKQPLSTTKLNLGCGGKPEQGYINCDLYPGPGIDEVFSLDEVPYADASVDEIASEHALEHLPRPKAHAAVAEWARVLKPGGIIKLKIPDLEECCKNYLQDPINRETWWLHTLYGVQDFRHENKPPNMVNYGQIHYTGFTETSIVTLLAKNGLITDKIEKYDGFSTPSLSLIARKPLPGNGKKIALINNSLNIKYLSYGDYWLDAFKALGHNVTQYRYENISNLPLDCDMYFFIEKRYDPSQITTHAHPKVLYTCEPQDLENIKYFDWVITPHTSSAAAWAQTCKTLVIPNENQVKGAETIVEIVSTPEELRAVDIIIPSYKNLDYLKLAIESVRRNTLNYRLIVCNSGEDSNVRDYLKNQKDIILIDTTDKRSFSQNINSGLQLSNNDVVLLNNDVIVGKNWLETLKNSSFDITNPYSNCDAGWIHNYYESVDNVVLKPDMTISQVNTEKLMNLSSSKAEVISRPWVAFYATYIKRKVIKSVGLLDDKFLNGGEDYDYCRRATKMGFTCGHNFSSWVFHFGGKTRKVSESENFNRHHEEDAYNQKVMGHKDRPTIAIYTGPAHERWTIKNITTTGIGGSETCAAMLAKQFVAKGYRTLLIGDCESLEGDYDGVEYYDWKKFDNLADTNYFDYFISSRTLAPLRRPVRSGKNYVWVHDIWLSNLRELGDVSKVNKFICLSPWHIQFFSQHHQVPTNKIYTQENGLEISRYDDYESIEKDPYRLFYSSSPDRGLITLLKQFKEIRKEFPKANLHVYYGTFNWKSAIKQRNDPQEMQHLLDIEEMMKQEGVFNHDRVPQDVLAKEQMRSSLWVYPTLFTETFCITAREAMLAGAVPICTDLAGLSELSPDCAIKVKTPDQCLEHTLSLLRNPSMQKYYREAGRKLVKEKYSWDTVADNWIKMFNET